MQSRSPHPPEPLAQVSEVRFVLALGGELEAQIGNQEAEPKQRVNRVGKMRQPKRVKPVEQKTSMPR